MRKVLFTIAIVSFIGGIRAQKIAGVKTEKTLVTQVQKNEGILNNVAQINDGIPLKNLNFNEIMKSLKKNKLVLGINGGIPLTNLKDTHSAAFGFDISYLYSTSENFQIGATTGFNYFSGKTVNNNKMASKSYIPIAAAFKFNSVNDKFFIGTDLGFAYGVSPSGDQGGLYFRPYLGIKIFDRTHLTFAYTGIKKRDPIFSYGNLGLAFEF